MEGQQWGLVCVPGHPRCAGPSSGNLRAGLSRELPSKMQLRTIHSDEVMGVMARKRRVKPSPRGILKRRVDHGLWSPSIQLQIPPPWNPRGALPSYVPSWLRPPGLHGFCHRPGSPLGALGGGKACQFLGSDVDSLGSRSDRCICSTSSWAPVRSPCPRPLPQPGG